MLTEALAPTREARGEASEQASEACALPVRCAHCGLAVARGLVREGRSEQFCCHGCETAYEVIHRCGLGRYYQMREGSEGAVRSSGRSYAEFDDATFRTLYATRDARGLWRAELYLTGMHCAACVWLVERLPRLLDGVVSARVDLGRSLVVITWDDARTRLSEVARELEAIGYPPSPARDAKARAGRRVEDRRQLVRLAVAGACAGNVMLFSIALYAGAFSAMEQEYRVFFRWASLVLTVVSLAWPGRVFFASAWYAIRTRSAHFDVPIALALAAGAGWAAWTTVLATLGLETTLRGSYFDSVAVLVFALLVGRFLQARQQRQAADSVELLFSLTPGAARRVRGADEEAEERVEEVPVENLVVGDVVEVRPGECFPADGEVEKGQSAVDAAVLTGESRAVEVGVGANVAAGTTNVTSVVRVRVSAAGEATRIAKLMRLVEEGARRRAPIVEFADKVAAYFAGGMLVLAGLTLGVWLFVEPSRALDHAVALLVVTCPCALGLATPLTMTIAMGRAAKRRMLIKGGEAIQRLAGPKQGQAGRNRGTIFLDKTGTITQGGLSLAAWEGAAWAKPLVAALERQSNHPVGVALARDCGPAAAGVVTDVTMRVGGGLSGVIDGRRVVVGSRGFVMEAAGGAAGAMAGAFDAMTRRGLTPVGVVVDGALVAVAGLGDVVREDAAAAVARLKAMGYRVAVLSGDEARVVEAVAAKVGIGASEALGGRSPEQKLAAVEAAKREGLVVMVGDGVNDAAALAAADVGVAVHGGVEASLAAADVYLGRAGLMPLVELVEASGRTMGTIRRNLVISVFYNGVAGALAMLGLVSPLVAALVMPVSSLTAVGVSMRSRTFGNGAEGGGE
ncbi:MAG: heavy metal translocating P-type ATPase [Tepidisphaera sp.]|nr:heavy metal translocating P-type ATPase [Tepidisphaera sp.]